MKHWWWAVLWILLPVLSSGQNTKKADRWFDRGACYKALEEYRSVLSKQPDGAGSGRIFFRVGVCHLRTGSYREAQEWLERAIVADVREDEVYNRLGEAYLYLGEYEKAREAFRKYQLLNPDDQRLANRIASCDFARKAPKENPDVRVEPFPYLNTSGSEYGILFVHGGILYSSTGEEVLKKERDRSPRTGLGYSKPYLSFLQDGAYRPGVLLEGISRQRSEEGSFAYDAGSEQLFCTRCEENTANCEIIKARLKGFRFQETGVLQIGKGRFNLAHPFVENNGGRIYFSSTRAGGYGASDIWYVDRSPDGRWGEPENLGPNVNTPGNEVFPHLWEGILFFASDGHVGYGGLDLFRAEPEGALWGRAQNLGAGMNTSSDDFNLIMHSDGTGGLFISNRTPGRSDDIFQFEFRSFAVALQGRIRDKESGQALPQAAVMLVSGGTEQPAAVDAAGTFSVRLTDGVTYRLTVTAPGYRPLVEEIKAENDRNQSPDRKYHRLEKAYFLEPAEKNSSAPALSPAPASTAAPVPVSVPASVPVPVFAPADASATGGKQPVGSTDIRWEVLTPPAKWDIPLPQTADPERLPYTVTVQEGELTGQTAPKGWWIQVAMLRESESLPAAWLTRLLELTGKQVAGYRGADGGKRFYLGVYPEEQEARRVVALLKENGFDCFVKRVSE